MFLLQYYLKCELKRPLLNKDIQKVVEFMVEIPPPPKAIKIPVLIGSGPATGGKPIKFVLTPDSLQNVKDVR